MSATIMMPNEIDNAIREMCADAMTQAVDTLAAKYGFDAEEANRFLASDELKIVRKRGPAAKDNKPKPKKSPVDVGDKPKRAKTGYLLYADQVRQEVKDELTAELAEGTKLKPQNVVKAIALRWKDEDQEVKDEWKQKAKTPPTSDDEMESSTPPPIVRQQATMGSVKPDEESDVEMEEPEPEPKPSKKPKKSKKPVNPDESD